MKHIVAKLIMVVVILFGTLATLACEIDFEILENKKEQYQKGDVIIVKISVVFNHRRCPEGIKATKFSYEGLKVLGATKWVEPKANTYERKFKIEILDDSKESLIFSAIRTCDKEGGKGSIQFKINQPMQTKS